MSNINERMHTLETEKLFIKGYSGAEFEFNYIDYDGDIKKLSEYLGSDYAGIYLFAVKTTNKVLFKGESSDIAQALATAIDKDTLPALENIVFCYCYEYSTLLRKDIVKDIIVSDCKGYN